MQTLDSTPDVVLKHEAEKQEAHVEQKKARSHKYVVYSELDKSSSSSMESYDHFSSIAWILNLLLCHRHSKRKSRYHHKEKHSLGGKTGKTHAVSIGLRLPLIGFGTDGAGFNRLAKCNVKRHQRLKVNAHRRV